MCAHRSLMRSPERFIKLWARGRRIENRKTKRGPISSERDNLPGNPTRLNTNRNAARHERRNLCRVRDDIRSNRDNLKPVRLLLVARRSILGAGATTSGPSGTIFSTCAIALVSSGTTLRSIAMVFSLGAVRGTPDASTGHTTGPRRVWVGSLARSFFIHCRGCPAVLRPRQSGGKYECELSQENRDGNACAGVHPRAS